MCCGRRCRQGNQRNGTQESQQGQRGHLGYQKSAKLIQRHTWLSSAWCRDRYGSTILYWISICAGTTIPRPPMAAAGIGGRKCVNCRFPVYLLATETTPAR